MTEEKEPWHLISHYPLRFEQKRFWGSLKTELVHDRNFAARAEAESAIREYIEVFYNRQRRHSRLGYDSPVVFANNFR